MTHAAAARFESRGGRIGPGRAGTCAPRIAAASCLAALGVAAGAVQAHHSIAAVYDSTRSVSVEGKVTEFRFVNPHPVLVIAVDSSRGEPESWRLEMDNRSELTEIGVDAQTFRPGDRVIARGHASRLEDRSLYLMRLERPADGLRYEQVGYTPRLDRRRGTPR